MIRKKKGGILLIWVLCVALIVAMGLVAAGEEIQEPPADETMKISDPMVNVLKQLEGFSPYAYWDYQQYSIGYGSKCPEGMENYYTEEAGNQISLEYAEELLRNELDYFEGQINAFIKRNQLTLAQHQYDALVSFTYNTGKNWNSESGNLVQAIFDGDTGSHFIYGMMLWSMAGNRHILIDRRIVETNIYANGVYPENVFAADAKPDRYRIAFMDANGGTVKYDEHGFDAEQPVAIKTEFKSAPSGPDESGALVTYEFDGWYTQREGGTKVEILDETIATGTVLYAHWKTPGGTPVSISRQETGMKVTVTVTGSNVNVRSGPDTYYASLYQALKGDTLEIEEVSSRGGLLWGRFGDQWICLKYTDYDKVIEKLLPMWGQITANTLNVRKGAGTGYATVEGAQKKQGDLVLITQWKTDDTMMWGKIEEGWIALPYVSFEGVSVPDKAIQSVELLSKPTKLTYVHKAEELDLTGGKLLVTYEDGSTSIVVMTADMATGFDNTELGTKTITVLLDTQSVTFDVEIVKAKVSFFMDDGSIILENEYLFGDTVTVPENPSKPKDSEGHYYVFMGWGKEVATSCDGNAVYTAVFEQRLITGDCNNDGQLTDQDAIYLLRHVYFPDRYPVEEPADYNQDGQLTDQDAIYLLRHVYFPDRYPLY